MAALECAKAGETGMRILRAGIAALVLSAAGAAAQEAASPYEALRAPAMAAYEAGEAERAFTLFQNVFEQIPASDPAERASTAFSLAVLAHQLEDRSEALSWLERGFGLHEAAGTAPETYAAYIVYAGTIHAEQDEPASAISYFERALEVGPQGADTAEWRANAQNQLANALHAEDRFAEAAAVRREALAGYRAVYGDEHAYVATVLDGLATDLLADGQNEEAITVLSDALAVRIAISEPGDLDVVATAGRLARQIADTDTPERLLAIADMIEARTNEDRHRARFLAEIAASARYAGHTAITDTLHARAYQAASADSDTPPDFLLIYLLNHAVGVQEQSGYAAALPLLEEHYRRAVVFDGEAGTRGIAASERLWTALFRLARFADAEANARARLEALQARADFPALETGRALENLALSIHEQYRPAEAHPVFEQAMEVLEPLEEGRHVFASLLDAYAIHLAYHGSREDALATARRNVALRAELYGQESASHARGLTTLADVLRRYDRSADALAVLDQAQAIHAALGPSGNEARAGAMLQRAVILLEQGMVSQSEALLIEVDGVIPATRADYRRDWHQSMGKLRRAQGRLTEALGHFREVLALRTAQDGEDARANVFPLLEIATTLRMQENLTEAEAVARRALAIHEAYGVTSGTDLGVAWGELASILSRQGRHNAALEASNRANALIAAERPRGTQARAIQDYNHALLLMNQARYREAEALMAQSIADFRSIDRRSDVFLGAMMNSYGYLNERVGAHDAAAAAYREGLELRQDRLSNDNPALASGRAFLARSLIDHLGEPEEGLFWFRAASEGLIEGIMLRAGTSADDGADGIEFARKDAFFTAHLEALWTNAQLDR